MHKSSIIAECVVYIFIVLCTVMFILSFCFVSTGCLSWILPTIEEMALLQQVDGVNLSPPCSKCSRHQMNTIGSNRSWGNTFTAAFRSLSSSFWRAGSLWGFPFLQKVEKRGGTAMLALSGCFSLGVGGGFVLGRAVAMIASRLHLIRWYVVLLGYLSS